VLKYLGKAAFDTLMNAPIDDIIREHHKQCKKVQAACVKLSKPSSELQTLEKTYHALRKRLGESPSVEDNALAQADHIRKLQEKYRPAKVQKGGIVNMVGKTWAELLTPGTDVPLPKGMETEGAVSDEPVEMKVEPSTAAEDDSAAQRVEEIDEDAAFYNIPEVKEALLEYFPYHPPYFNHESQYGKICYIHHHNEEMQDILKRAAQAVEEIGVAQEAKARAEREEADARPILRRYLPRLCDPVHWVTSYRNGFKFFLAANIGKVEAIAISTSAIAGTLEMDVSSYSVADVLMGLILYGFIRNDKGLVNAHSYSNKVDVLVNGVIPLPPPGVKSMSISWCLFNLLGQIKTLTRSTGDVAKFYEGVAAMLNHRPGQEKGYRIVKKQQGITRAFFCGKILGFLLKEAKIPLISADLGYEDLVATLEAKMGESETTQLSIEPPVRSLLTEPFKAPQLVAGFSSSENWALLYGLNSARVEPLPVEELMKMREVARDQRKPKASCDGCVGCTNLFYALYKQRLTPAGMSLLNSPSIFCTSRCYTNGVKYVIMVKSGKLLAVSVPKYKAQLAEAIRLSGSDTKASILLHLGITFQCDEPRQISEKEGGKKPPRDPRQIAREAVRELQNLEAAMGGGRGDTGEWKESEVERLIREHLRENDKDSNWDDPEWDPEDLGEDDDGARSRRSASDGRVSRGGKYQNDLYYGVGSQERATPIIHVKEAPIPGAPMHDTGRVFHYVFVEVMDHLRKTTCTVRGTLIYNQRTYFVIVCHDLFIRDEHPSLAKAHAQLQHFSITQVTIGDEIIPQIGGDNYRPMTPYLVRVSTQEHPNTVAGITVTQLDNIVLSESRRPKYSMLLGNAKLLNKNNLLFADITSGVVYSGPAHLVNGLGQYDHFFTTMNGHCGSMLCIAGPMYQAFAVHYLGFYQTSANDNFNRAYPLDVNMFKPIQRAVRLETLVAKETKLVPNAKDRKEQNAQHAEARRLDKKRKKADAEKAEKAEPFPVKGSHAHRQRLADRKATVTESGSAACAPATAVKSENDSTRESSGEAVSPDATVIVKCPGTDPSKDPRTHEPLNCPRSSVKHCGPSSVEDGH
jgi:hypothetical protein